MTIICYADCPSGASGDMILAAFLDLGLPLDRLKGELAKLDLGGYDLDAGMEKRQGLAARRLVVKVRSQDRHRHWSDIRDLIGRSALSPLVKEKALAVFARLAEAEGRMHGLDPERVHFHEVGAVDSIVDIVGAAVAWEYFGLERLYVSPLPLGAGWVETAHGRLPLPAPGALALLENAPVYGTGLQAELVTPTGAAILTALASDFGPWPAMTITKVGRGAGSRDLPDRPNILRLVLGRSAVETTVEHLIVGETNLDDMNPEVLPYLMDRLLEAEALDVWLTPIQMKKGRPGVQLAFLARPGRVQALLEIVLAETTTLGVRTYPVQRQALARAVRTLAGPWGEVSVKVIKRGAEIEVIPEYEACRRAARETGRPLREIYDQIKALGEKALKDGLTEGLSKIDF